MKLSDLKPQATDFNHNYHGSEKHGRGSESYVRHNVDVYNDITFKGTTFSAVYQTGVSFYHNDYSQPSAKLELSSDGGTDKVLCTLDSLTEQDIENMNEQDLLEYVDCDVLTSRADVQALYNAINDNLFDARSYFDCVFDDEFEPDFIDDLTDESRYDF